jgi:hypothetical protein
MKNLAKIVLCCGVGFFSILTSMIHPLGAIVGLFLAVFFASEKNSIARAASVSALIGTIIGLAMFTLNYLANV